MATDDHAGASVPPLDPLPGPSVAFYEERARWYRDGCEGLEDLDGYRYTGALERDAAADLLALCSRVRDLETALAALRATAVSPQLPVGVLNANARMREPEKSVELTDAQKPTAECLKSLGFIEDHYVLAYCWSTREGMGDVDLEFYPINRHANDAGFLAIVGCHASGENPRLRFGTCETLADVQMVCEAVRRINGYKQPEPWRTGHLAERAGIAPPTYLLNGWRELGEEMERILHYMASDVRADVLPDWFEPRLKELLAASPTWAPE